MEAPPAPPTFINKSGLTFTRIDSEEERVYIFPNGRTLVIDSPLFLNVSNSGGHRLFAASGYSFYVQPAEGWAVMWKAKDGEPNFVK